MLKIDSETSSYMYLQGVTTIRDLRECIGLQRGKMTEYRRIARACIHGSHGRRTQVMLALECRRIYRGLKAVLSHATTNGIHDLDSLRYTPTE